MDQGRARLLSRQARELLPTRCSIPSPAEAASAALGRRREPGRAPPRHQVRQRLVSRQQQPDQAPRYRPAPRRRHRRRQAHVRGGQARSGEPRRRRCSCRTSSSGASTRPRTARRGACSPAPRPTWRPMPLPCRRPASAMWPCGSAGRRARTRGAHRALRRRGDRQEPGARAAARQLARSPCAWQSSAADRPGSTSRRCGSGGIPATRCGSFEQNAADATWGFGVVFSDQALEFLRDDDPDTVAAIAPHMQAWRDIAIVHRGERGGDRRRRLLGDRPAGAAAAPAAARPRGRRRAAVRHAVHVAGRAGAAGPDRRRRRRQLAGPPRRSSASSAPR